MILMKKEETIMVTTYNEFAAKLSVKLEDNRGILGADYDSLHSRCSSPRLRCRLLAQQISL